MPDYTKTALTRMAAPLEEDQAKKDETLRRQAALEAIARPAQAGYGQATGMERMAAAQGGLQRASQAGASTAGIAEQQAQKQTAQASNLAGVEQAAQKIGFAEEMAPRQAEIAARQQAVEQKQAGTEMTEEEASTQAATKKAELAWQEVAQSNSKNIKSNALAVRELAQKSDQFNMQREIAKYQFDQGLIDKADYARQEAAFAEQQAKLQGEWEVKEAELQSTMTDRIAEDGFAENQKLMDYYKAAKQKSGVASLFPVVGGVVGGVLGSIIPGLGTTAGAMGGASLGGAAGTAYSNS